jgi:uncharacterized Zn finger protein
MICSQCESENMKYEVVEETKEGYVWEYECLNCGHIDSGYEF